MLSDDQGVYLVSPQIRSNLDHPLGALHPISRIDFNSELLDRIEVAGDDGAFALEHNAGMWQIISPYQHPADPGALAALRKDIGAMRLAVYVDQASALDMAEYGLSSPKRSITFHLAESVIITPPQDEDPGSARQVPAQEMTFAIGKDIDGIGFYCLYQDAVYQASYASMGFLTTISLDELTARNPVIIPINQLSSLTVNQEGISREYQVELVERIEKNNALSLDEAGQQLYDPVISLNGQDFEQPAFIREYLKLMDLGGIGRLPANYKPEGKPVVSYAFLAEGLSLELAFYQYDALHLAMAVNGHALFYTTKQAVQDIAL